MSPSIFSSLAAWAAGPGAPVLAEGAPLIDLVAPIAHPDGEPDRGLTAAATRLKEKKVGTAPAQASADNWQGRAWDMYDSVGELRFVASTLAGRLSQARLFVARRNADSAVPVEVEGNDPVNAILEGVGRTPTGRSQLLHRLALALFVPGEAWLVGIPPELLDGTVAAVDDAERPGGKRRAPAAGGQRRVTRPTRKATGDGIPLEGLEWRVMTGEEVKIGQDGIELSFAAGREDKIKAGFGDVAMIRVWRPHPRKAWEADSPVRAALPILAELVGLTAHVAAQVQSRLAGAGVLIVPQTASAAVRAQAGLSPDDLSDPLSEALIEAMITPIADRDSASAVVPLVLTVPDESAEKFKHLTFTAPLDEKAQALRDEALRRLALSLDCPPELLTGVGGMNHWGAWLVQEDVVTTHLEPVLALICDALTTRVLRPALAALGKSPEEVYEYTIGYDVTHLVSRPNRATDALALYDRGVLSDETLRDATGFEETDAPVQIEEASDKLDAASRAALQMAQANPALFAQQGGLPEIVRQIRAVMDDDIPDAPPAAPAADPAPAADQPTADETTADDRRGVPAKTSLDEGDAAAEAAR